jgi:hypothetical protein
MKIIAAATRIKIKMSVGRILNILHSLKTDTGVYQGITDIG